MKTLKIHIPDMQSTHCQTRVNNAMKHISGLVIEQLVPGTSIVSFDDSVNQTTISETITNAGYQITDIESLDTSQATLRFKTNINCSGCVAKVSTTMDELKADWKVDTENPKKVLTVTADQISEYQIIQAVQKAGFKIEPLNS